MPIVLLLAALSAAVDAKESAREYSHQASVAYNLGHYEEAATLYESAYRLVQDPTLLFNIGQSYRLAGRPGQALAAYKGFLRTAPDDNPNRTAASARAAEMEKLVNEARKPPPAPPARGDADTKTAARPEPPPGRQTAARARPTESPPPPLVASDSETPFGTTAGAAVGSSGQRDNSAAQYRGFVRLTDSGKRTWELGYFRRPIYPMNPTYRVSALYLGTTSPAGLGFELGALGADGGWHAAVSKSREQLAFGLRLEGASPEALCGSNASILYAIPDVRFRLPVTSSFTVNAGAAYRGKLSAKHCDFRPSMLTLDISGDLTLSTSWALTGGLGHYGLHDFGTGSPGGQWIGGRDNSVEYLRVGARYVWERMTFFLDVRPMTYSGITWESILGAEFRSNPHAR